MIIDESTPDTRSQVSHETQILTEIGIGVPLEKEKESTRESDAMPLESIVPPEPSILAPDPEEYSGDTIVVRPPTEITKPRTETFSQQGLRRSGRQRQQEEPTPRAMLANLDEPQTLCEALERDNSDQWYEAWVSEVDSLVRNQTWSLASLPEGREAIGCRWIFKLKDDGRYKARLVAKGYSQKAGVDYTETFAPVAKFNSLLSLLALVSANNWELEGMDVKRAFLHSELDEEVFMDIAEGLHIDIINTFSRSSIVCQLKKSIYGLKQSPQTWYGKINQFFIDHGFERLEQDHNVYIHKIFSLILLLYVDDLVLTSPRMDDMVWIQDLLHREFEMTDLGPLTCFLGREIRRDRRVRRLHLSQQKYIDTILYRQGMADSTPIATPADPHVQLLKSPVERQANPIKQQRYQSAVVSLMYTMIGT